VVFKTKTSYKVGTLKDPNSHYEGQIKNCQPHGQGTKTWHDKSEKYQVYRGQWLHGKMHGHGDLTLNEGDFYSGQFENDYLSGQGKRTWGNGDTYDGSFKLGLQSGQGTFTSEVNGFTYTGDW
jgi:hypothetical protein